MELNNLVKYDESIVTLEEIIVDNSSTSLDKYYAYLNKVLLPTNGFSTIRKF